MHPGGHGLRIDNDVALIWIPGHFGFKDNIIADILAKTESTSSIICPESALGV